MFAVDSLEGVGMLSDLVGAEVRRYREAAGLSREDVARRCTEGGWPGISAMVLLYIENGRSDASGRRRREVSVDELVALAYVLGVPPLALLAPLGDHDWQPFKGVAVESGDGGGPNGAVINQPTPTALRWLRGDYELPARSGPGAYEHLRQYLRADELSREFQQRVRELTSPPGSADDGTPVQSLPPLWKERYDRAESDLREIRARMRAAGWAPPRLPFGLDFIDEPSEGESNG